MKSKLIKNVLKFAFAIAGSVFLIHAAQSANFNSGKTKKKAAHKSSSSLSFNLHNKSNNLLSSNGFLYKGGGYVLKNQKSNLDIQIKSAYFTKGNSIYVQPMKNKVILTKFTLPQKQLN